MTCGLPTIATCHGGPAEIIVDGVSGLHIDPYHSDKAADILVNFFDKCKEDPSYWDKISAGGLQRIYDKYVIFSPAIYNTFINGLTQALCLVMILRHYGLTYACSMMQPINCLVLILRYYRVIRACSILRPIKHSMMPSSQIFAFFSIYVKILTLESLDCLDTPGSCTPRG